MRALLFPFGSHGDVRPFISLGRRLVERGHTVLLVANPRFSGLAQEAALPFEAVGSLEEYAAVLDNPELWHPQRGPMLLQKYSLGAQLPAAFDAVVRHRTDDTVVVAGTFAVGAALAAEKFGLPLARLQGQPSIFFGPHDLPTSAKVTRPTGMPMWLRRFLFGALDRVMMKKFLGKPLNAARAGYGLTPLQRNFMSCYHAGDTNLCMFPEWFGASSPDWPETARHVGFFLDPSESEGPLTDELERFLAEGEPPLVFTPGPAGYQHSSNFFDVAHAAVTLLERRAVFVTRGVPTEAASTDRVHVCDYAPFARLLPRSALAVHHGGIGTVAHCLAAGVPQLITPFGFDQPDHAFRVAERGVGGWILRKKMTAESLAARMTSLLAEPGLAERCAGAKQYATGLSVAPVDAACDLIEGLLPVA